MLENHNEPPPKNTHTQKEKKKEKVGLLCYLYLQWFCGRRKDYGKTVS